MIPPGGTTCGPRRSSTSRAPANPRRDTRRAPRYGGTRTISTSPPISKSRTAVRINGTLNAPHDHDLGWSLEVAIPWSDLERFAPNGVPPENGEYWRINFSRVEWDHGIIQGTYQKIPDRPEHNWVWSPQGVVDMHRPERWGIVQFSRASPGKDVFRPDPTLPARDALMELYYAQRAYRRQHGNWAERLGDLAEYTRPERSSPAAAIALNLSSHSVRPASPRKSQSLYPRVPRISPLALFDGSPRISRSLSLTSSRIFPLALFDDLLTSLPPLCPTFSAHRANPSMR